MCKKYSESSCFSLPEVKDTHLTSNPPSSLWPLTSSLLQFLQTLFHRRPKNNERQKFKVGMFHSHCSAYRDDLPLGFHCVCVCVCHPRFLCTSEGPHILLAFSTHKQTQKAFILKEWPWRSRLLWWNNWCRRRPSFLSCCVCVMNNWVIFPL